MIMIHAVESLFYAQVSAMRTANMIDPGSFIRPCGLDHKGVIIHPLAHRISVPTRFRVFWSFPSVGPDYPPYFAELVEK